MSELYKKHRPKSFKQVQGQDGPIKVLMKLVERGEIPHALLFTGPSGCGKTTLARILAAKLKCGKGDLYEINCADFRGIDMVREIRQRMTLASLHGSCRIWIIDEAHKLSNDAQNALLKILEDPPSHVYFFLATTEPEKLLKTIHTRCTQVAVKPLGKKDVERTLAAVLEKEDATLSLEVLERIIELAEGSARKALVLLHQVIRLDDEEDQLRVLASSDCQQQGIQIARALLNPRTSWSEMAKVLKEVPEASSDPESIRWIVLGYMTTVLLGGGKMAARAHLIIEAFRDHWYDCKRAGLVASCYEVISRK